VIFELTLPKEIFTKPVYFIKQGVVKKGMLESISISQNEQVAWIDVKNENCLWKNKPSNLFKTPTEAVDNFIKEYTITFESTIKALRDQAKELMP